MKYRYYFFNIEKIIAAAPIPISVLVSLSLMPLNSIRPEPCGFKTLVLLPTLIPIGL
jgi:hypothetical protein